MDDTLSSSIYENTIRQLRQEIERLKKLVEGAYVEGYYDGCWRGYYDYMKADWDCSDSKEALKEK